MKVVAIVQARMGSTRLPGKILKKINNKPILEYQIERLKRATKIDQIVIATTDKKLDDPIIELCNQLDIQYYRGSETDVLSRYYDTAKKYSADIIVRLTSDCPIIDPNVVDEVIETFLNHTYDYVSNTLERSYPRGMDTEVFSMKVLEQAHQFANKQYEREHVTPYIYLNPAKFNLYNVEYKTDESVHRWTVDTKEDLLLIRKIIEKLYTSSIFFTMEDTLRLLEEYSDWKDINVHIEQKMLGVK